MHIQTYFRENRIRILLFLILPLLALFAFSVTANASGSDFNIKDFEKFDSDSLYGKAYGFSLRYIGYSTANGNPVTSVTEFSIVSDRPIFVCLEDAYSTNGPIYGAKLFYLKEDGTVAYLNGGEGAGAVVSNYDWVCRRDSDGSLVNSSHYDYGKRPVLYVQETFFANIGDMSCTSYVFDSVESAKAYYENGDRSGILSYPPADVSVSHDFNADVYDANIPVPELSDLHHNGFTVNNRQDGLFLDVIVYSKFYGVTHETRSNLASNAAGSLAGVGGSSVPVYPADESWEYASHYYNFADGSEKSTVESVVDISEVWDTDNEQTLIEDFMRWTDEYPAHAGLPDYNFFKHNSSAWTQEWYYHNYAHSPGTTPAQKLALSGQAETTFVVRFYDRNMNCGRWISYTYKNAGHYGDDTVTMGLVDGSTSGNTPVISNPQTGKQDSDGSLKLDGFTSNGVTSDGIDTTNIFTVLSSLLSSLNRISSMFTSVISSIMEMAEMFAEFNNFLKSAFTFIPVYIWGIIGTGFSISVVFLVFRFFRG